MDIRVPKELNHSLFFPHDVIEENAENGWDDLLFLPEFLYYTNRSEKTPWVNSDEYIPVLLNNWGRVKGELIVLLKERNNHNNDIELRMLEGIQLYFTLLFWSNHKPVQLFDWQNQVNLLEIKPVNIEERLSFILAKHRTYPAFIQLSELFIEQQKHYIRKITIKKYKQK